jgi:hypothetical protein
MPEFRGAQDGGWSTAEEAVRASGQFQAHIDALEKNDPIRVRIALAYYLHLAEGSGFYEIPKKLMLTVEGKGNNLYPFQSLVKKHQKTGRNIDPNANAIIKNMMGHAFDLGLRELSDVFEEAFDSDLRNAIAHADYIVAQEGIRIRKKNGGYPKVITWQQFDAIYGRGINLFHILRQITEDYVKSYDPPKDIPARLNKNEPEFIWTIYYEPETGAFGVRTGGRGAPPKAANAVK